MIRKILIVGLLFLAIGLLVAQEQEEIPKNEIPKEETPKEEAPKKTVPIDRSYVGEEAPKEDPVSNLLKKIEPGLVSISHDDISGSGFIISPDGYILTNGHVVSKAVNNRDEEDPKEVATGITVKLYNDKQYSAKVIGFSLDPDVALIKIDVPEILTPFELSNSDTVMSGQKVYAYGAPGGLKRTLTSGIVSNSERSDVATFTNVIQTDAAINPGNSGGPLLNETGEVIGINTYGGGGQGIGFTIPINVAKVLKEHYLKYGYFKRADFPFFATNKLNDELSRALRIDKGILVDYVFPNSLADKAGLKNGDVIIELNDQPVSAKNDAELLNFNWKLSTMEIGGVIKLKVKRVSKENYTDQIISGNLVEDEPAVEHGHQIGEIKELRYDDIGLGVKRMTTLTSMIYRIPNINGVRVVRSYGAAAKAGISDPGNGRNRIIDIITHIDGQLIKDVEQFQTELENRLAKSQKYILITLCRGNETIKTAIKPNYELSGKKIILILPEGEVDYLERINRFLISNGSNITKIIADKDLKNSKASDFDAVMICNGPNVQSIWDNQQVHEIIKTAVKEKKVIGAIGAASITLINADSLLLEKKITTNKNYSQNLIDKKANYTGSDVETDNLIITTTGFDKDKVKQFLNEFRKAIKSNE